MLAPSRAHMHTPTHPHARARATVTVIVLFCVSLSLSLVMGVAAGAQDEAAKLAAKKPTAKEILEEEKAIRIANRRGNRVRI